MRVVRACYTRQRIFDPSHYVVSLRVWDNTFLPKLVRLRLQQRQSELYKLDPLTR